MKGTSSIFPAKLNKLTLVGVPSLRLVRIDLGVLSPGTKHLRASFRDVVIAKVASVYTASISVATGWFRNCEEDSWL